MEEDVFDQLEGVRSQQRPSPAHLRPQNPGTFASNGTRLTLGQTIGRKRSDDDAHVTGTGYRPNVSSLLASGFALDSFQGSGNRLPVFVFLCWNDFVSGPSEVLFLRHRVIIGFLSASVGYRVVMVTPVECLQVKRFFR